MVNIYHTWHVYIKNKRPFTITPYQYTQTNTQEFLYISHMSNISPDSDVIKNNSKLF